MNPINMNMPTYRLTASDTSGAVQLSDADLGKTSVIVSNTTDNDAWVVSGKTSPTAAFPSTGNKDTGCLVQANSTQVFTKNPQDGYIAAILTSGGSGDLFFQVGSGE